MRIRKSTKRWIGMVILLILLICGIFYMFYCSKVERYGQHYQSELFEAYELINANRKSIWAARMDLGAGEILTQDKLIRKEVISEIKEELLIDESFFYRRIILDVPEGMAVTKNMLSDQKESQEEGWLKSGREVQYNIFSLPEHINENDFCDIRISYPNGETYVVMAKKQIISISDTQQDCCLIMTPEEIDRMQSCIVDAASYGGSKIFLTRYIEPNIQEASKVSYIPSVQTIELIQSDPNIIEISSGYLSRKAREELEHRLSKDKDYFPLENEEFNQAGGGYNAG